MSESCSRIMLRILQLAVCLCMAGCASSPFDKSPHKSYTLQECFAIVKAKGIDIEDLSEPQVLGEKVRNPMFLVGVWSGKVVTTSTCVGDFLRGDHESQTRGVGVYDFRADGTYTVTTTVDDEKLTNLMNSTFGKQRVFGTWRMDGDILVLKETAVYDKGTVGYRDIEKRVVAVQYGHNEIGLKSASLADEKSFKEQYEKQHSRVMKTEHPSGFGYDRQNRRVSWFFVPYKDSKGSMTVMVSSNTRLVRTDKLSTPLAAAVPAVAPLPSHPDVGVSVSSQTMHDGNQRYTLDRFAWSPDGDLRCGFEYKINGECTLDILIEIERDVCTYIRNSYLAAHPTVDARSVQVDARPSFANGRVVGTGTVMAIAIVSNEYDETTRRGKVSVRFNAEQYEIARVWVRRNIERLARDKNILLMTGETPPSGRYISGDERVIDTPNGKVLEMEFKTE